MAFIGLLSIAGFVVFLILLIINVIKKRSKKISIIGLPFCFILFVVALAISPPSSSTHDDRIIPALKEEVSSSPVETTKKIATSESTTAPTANSETPTTAQLPKNPDKTDSNIKNNLITFGLNDMEIQSVIDTLEKVSENNDLSAYTYELEKGKNPKPIVEIKDTQSTIMTINLMDYMGLNSNYAYSVGDTTGSIYVNQYWGQGTVDGKDVYATASYKDYSSIGQELELNTISLYQLDNNSLYRIGEIYNGEVKWSTDFLKREYPLTMNVGEVYDFIENDDNTGLYLKRAYKVLGFKDITVSGKIFQDCIELQQIDELITPAGNGTVTSYTWYYSKDFGYVYFNLNTVNIKSDINEPIKVYTSSGYYIEGIDGKQLAGAADLYPFVPVSN